MGSMQHALPAPPTDTPFLLAPQDVCRPLAATLRVVGARPRDPADLHDIAEEQYRQSVAAIRAMAVACNLAEVSGVQRDLARRERDAARREAAALRARVDILQWDLAEAGEALVDERDRREAAEERTAADAAAIRDLRCRLAAAEGALDRRRGADPLGRAEVGHGRALTGPLLRPVVLVHDATGAGG
jgi:hypothetical protein